MKPIGIAVVVTCFVLTSPTTAPTQDASKDRTASSQRKKTMPKEFLKSLVGNWEGSCQTWFGPGKLADESKVKGEIHSILGDRFLRHSYEGTIQGKPRHGEETIAFNSITKRFQISWFDDF